MNNYIALSTKQFYEYELCTTGSGICFGCAFCWGCCADRNVLGKKKEE